MVQGDPASRHMNPSIPFVRFRYDWLIHPTMLKQAALQPSLAFFPRRPVLSAGSNSAVLPFGNRRRQNGNSNKVRCAAAADESSAAGMEPPTLLTATKRPATVKAVVTVLMTVGGVFAHVGITRGLDDFGDLFGRSLRLELVGATLDPQTESEKKTVSAFAHKTKTGVESITYEATFSVPPNFGEIGAVAVRNEHHEEMFLKDIVLTIDGDDSAPLVFSCRSWLHSKFDDPQDRVFFTSNKSYLPSETPSGLQRLRQRELEILRGDGTGQRKKFERIYDYDVYNDLGNPDSDSALARPVLGGSVAHPYPRRCRTGRPPTHSDPKSEQRSGNVYVPRDESFSAVKQVTFSAKTVRSVMHALLPSLETAMVDARMGFPYFTAIDKLFDEGVALPPHDSMHAFRTIVPRLVKALAAGAQNLLQFEVPEMIDRDKFSWFRDEEFSRQTLAGLNPLSIQLVTEFPFVSKLDPSIYGSPESLITAELIEREIKGIMAFKEALEQKKLFILDYHDLLLPFVHKIRELEDSTLYASRTLFFLTPEGTLRPIAIELTRPASPKKPQWRQVFTPSWDATGAWLWRLAKVHVVAHDAGYHQLVSHWLRTHCCMEPYIIAGNRQLSQMHPIYRLMHPYFRYTMEINALARVYLVNANGIIEQTFAPGKYSLELCSAAYGQQWRFDMEALPADLIRRGMAVEDPEAEHGLRLTIEDYPYAQDGLLIWSAVEQWVADYVGHYYSSPADIAADSELQSWWTEVRTKGHADKQNEPWWPSIDSQDDLVRVLTTIIWVASGHHAAVNFGQYQFGGYFPNRPSTARTNMPVEDASDSDLAKFRAKPEAELLRCFPSKIQATLVMAILDVLSSHAPDEEYLGKEAEAAWEKDPVIHAAFERFNGRLREIEGIIDGRNADSTLMNRCGAGIVPYQLLKPYSEPGVTGMGVPNSISI
ncbi:linoleate 13S-lipoxygenase 2-1, chloroplastic-like [Zingiber officinale]|uniref:linoleate 13S-lipoxygenase 2-1, chloroplastic-like n=1 Tax=Zingiber officinale TaxID=94328 RepID=UPI001C4D1AF5|nr:linoleate 13S-lipoxygenase 2-1, chloroplastic-like [Zingiber officinale]